MTAAALPLSSVVYRNMGPSTWGTAVVTVVTRRPLSQSLTTWLCSVITMRVGLPVAKGWSFLLTRSL